MPNIAAVLKEEIVRLARKEVRRQTEKLRRGSLQHRKSIAKLNREIQELRRQLTKATAHAGKPASAQPADQPPQRVRFSAAGLRSRRERLGLSAESFGRLFGVSSQTIYNWEHGVARPGAHKLRALALGRKIGKRDTLRLLERLEGLPRKKRRKA